MSEQKGQNIIVQGRIVWGGVKVKGRTQQGTQTPAIDPKTGTQIMEYAFGLAIPKPNSQSTPEEIANVNLWWNAIQSEAAKIFPNGLPPKFAWKYVDGDTVKPSDGSPYPEHYKGCMVVACTTRIPLKLVAWQDNGKGGRHCVQVDESYFKTGDYVQVQLNINAHPSLNGGSAGLYVNPIYVAHVGYGKEIINTPDPTVVFGNVAPTIRGASATPIGTMNVPQMGAAPQTQGFPQAQQQFAPPPVQPHHAVLPGQFQPQAQPMGNAPSAPAVGNGFPTMGQQAPMQQMQTAQYPTPATGFPQGNAQTAAFPGNGMPQMPGFPQQ